MNGNDGYSKKSCFIQKTVFPSDICHLGLHIQKNPKHLNITNSTKIIYNLWGSYYESTFIVS